MPLAACTYRLSRPQTGDAGIDINHASTLPGVAADAGQALSLTPGGNVVADSTVSNFGRICQAFRPGIRSNGFGVRIEGNEISYGPHAALMPAGNENAILRNSIHHVVMQASDMGAIDSRGQWINRGTSITGNLFYSIGNHEDGGCNSASLYGCTGKREPVPLNCSAIAIYIGDAQTLRAVLFRRAWWLSPFVSQTGSSLRSTFLATRSGKGRPPRHKGTADSTPSFSTAADHTTCLGTCS